MSFAETFELPFDRTVTVKTIGADGVPVYSRKTYKVELLTTQDLLPWIAELTEATKKKANELIPEKMKPQDIYAARVRNSQIECTPDSLRAPIAAGHGAIRVLELAADKIGLKDEERRQFIHGAGANQNQKDAFRAAAIMTEEEFSEAFIPKPKDLPPPNASSPSEVEE